MSKLIPGHAVEACGVPELGQIQYRCSCGFLGTVQEDTPIGWVDANQELYEHSQAALEREDVSPTKGTEA